MTETVRERLRRADLSEAPLLREALAELDAKDKEIARLHEYATVQVIIDTIKKLDAARAELAAAEARIADLLSGLDEANKRWVEARAEIEALRADAERMRGAILWALGENGTFLEEPSPLAGKYRRRYWWRTELRKRAAIDAARGEDR